MNSHQISYVILNIEKVEYVLNQPEKTLCSTLCPFLQIGFAYFKGAKTKRGHRSPLLVLN